MEVSLTTPKTTSHVRSISLPSRPHPLSSSIKDQVCRLRAAETSSTCSVSPICQKLSALKVLYEELNDVIQLPLNQQVLALDLHCNGLEEVLDGSLTLLDLCGLIDDSVTQMKESVLELQSSLRRKSGTNFAHYFDSYIVSRKKIKKIVSKCLKNFEKGEQQKDGIDNDNLIPIVKMLKELEAVCFSTLKSAIACLSRPKSMSKRHGWSLVSKLISTKLVSSIADANEVEKIDLALCDLDKKKSSLDMKVVQQSLLNQLETVESVAQELKDCIGLLSRCLVKTRVTLLNILNY